jgi:hypothetical protein
MDTMREPNSHWSAHTWKLVARVRGTRRGELDLAYANRGEVRLLIRLCPSITPRRLKEAQTMLRQGDFDWIIMTPGRMSHCKLPDGIEVFDEATLRQRAPDLLPREFCN